jgi:hypothetical protein
MAFLPKLLFNSATAEGGATVETTTTAPDTTTTTTEVTKVEIPADIQKELEELRAFRQTITEKESKTQEQIAKEAEIEKAEFIKFSAENDLMKVDDFARFETAKQRQDRELVFENFSKEWKDENKDATDDEVQEAFDNQYHVNSDSDKAKSRGEKLIAKEAKELRTPLETSYTKAKGSYEQHKVLKQDMPNFQKFIDSTIEKNISDKIKVYEKEIDSEKIAVDIEITKEEKKEIFDAVKKEIATHESYATWKKDSKDGKNERLEKMIAKEVKYLINEKKQSLAYESTATKFYEVGEKKGTAKGSNVGANNPFAVIRQMGVPQTAAQLDALQTVEKSDLELRRKLNRKAG